MPLHPMWRLRLNDAILLAGGVASRSTDHLARAGLAVGDTGAEVARSAAMLAVRAGLAVGDTGAEVARSAAMLAVRSAELLTRAGLAVGDAGVAVSRLGLNLRWAVHSATLSASCWALGLDCEASS